MSKRKRRTPRKRGQVRLDCPHCGKHILVQELARFQSTVPCPICHIPIARDFVEAAKQEYEEAQAAEDAGVAEAEASADEAAETEDE